VKYIYAVALSMMICFSAHAERKSFNLEYLNKSIIVAGQIKAEDWTGQRERLFLISILNIAKKQAQQLDKMEDKEEINRAINRIVMLIQIAIKGVDGVKFTKKQADDVVTAPDKAADLYGKLNQAAIDLVGQKT